LQRAKSKIDRLNESTLSELDRQQQNIENMKAELEKM
jgi:hypothetical protein